MTVPSPRRRRAFLTGITGQDGSYLAEFLLQQGYEVHAILRRSSVFTSTRIDHLIHHERVHTYHGDLTDSSNLHTLLARIEPDEIYNLGAQSHVAVSFEVPEYTAEVDALGTIRLLNAIKDSGQKPRFYQASTSELFGGLPGTAPQSETTPFYPKSPYGAAKLYAYWITVNYREAYGLYACNGILFNHESPRRGETFVTKKISKAAARIAQGRQQVLALGNLDAKRDWGHARDYVRGMWLMLQQDAPRDYVLASGETHTVREFATLAFREAGIELAWRGEGLAEQGVCTKTGAVRVVIDPKYFRPTEVELLWGDPAKARAELGWVPEVSFEQLVREMVRYDLQFDDYGHDGVVPLRMIVVTGATGFLGQRVCQLLASQGRPFTRISRSVGTDLRDPAATHTALAAAFEGQAERKLIHCAAHVGGIQFGLTRAAELFHHNLAMTLSLYEAAVAVGVQRLVNPISNCAYPGAATLFKEAEFWDGPLHDSVLAYGFARKASWVGAWAYQQQHGLDVLSLILSNMYGPGDHFEPERSHALGALIHRIHEAKQAGAAEVVIWGTGTPVREWLHVDDGAEALVRGLDAPATIEPVNIGVAQGLSILDMARMIAEELGYTGRLVTDPSKPDGAPYKTVDGTRGAALLGWRPQRDFRAGVRETIDWYLTCRK